MKNLPTVTLDVLLETIGIEQNTNSSLVLSGINTLQDAVEGEISFLDNKKYINTLKATKASAVLVTSDMVDMVPNGTIALVDDEPYLKLALASKLFALPIIDNTLPKTVIGKGTVVADGANIANGSIVGNNCQILPGVYLAPDVTIGDNTILHANVTIYRGCIIGSDCIIHSGTVIGSDGFGFATTKIGTHVKIYQNGNVIIENDVEIGSNTTIDRAAFGTTLIKNGVRIDNLVQIGHNCIIGEYSVLVSQSGLAGSTELGRNVVMGGQAAAAGHLKIAPFTQFAARAGITKDVKESHKVYGGFPLMEQKSWLKLQAKLARILRSK